MCFDVRSAGFRPAAGNFLCSHKEKSPKKCLEKAQPSAATPRGFSDSPSWLGRKTPCSCTAPSGLRDLSPSDCRAHSNLFFWAHPCDTDFLAHLQVERRMSAHTLDAYRRDLDALAAWASAQGSTSSRCRPSSCARSSPANIAAACRPRACNAGCRPVAASIAGCCARPHPGQSRRCDPRAESAAQVAAGARRRRGRAPGRSADRRAARACGIARCWSCSIPRACA
jgi:hypothetical protein